MDSHFNLVEISDTIDGLIEDDFNTELNVSCPGILDKSNLYCTTTSKAPETSLKGNTDCSAGQEVGIDNVNGSEDVDNLNSNVVLSYITQLLLEEDIDDEKNNYAENLALLATEKVFQDILRQEYFSPSDELLHLEPASQISSVGDSSNHNSILGVDNELVENLSEPDKLPATRDEHTWVLPTEIESITAQQMQRGVEEAMKFLPNIGEFFTSRESSGSSIGRVDRQSRNKKNLSCGDLDELVGRARKQTVPHSDEPIRTESFDKAFLHGGLKYIEDDPILREIIQTKTRNKSHHGRTLSYTTKKDKDKTVEEPADLKSLLIYCSQAVSSDDRALADELICKIRNYSSPNGDGWQRLVHCFVNALEARLAGHGIEIYREMLSKRPNIIEIVKYYHAYLTFSPYMRALVYFTNQSILNNISRDAKNVHIINYGILYGFQWPPLFEHFSNWDNRPPKLRVTMIEVPEPGFRPRKRVELIGQRLADYARSFNVPFEYEGIASKWEDVKVEDLKIQNDEVVIVNCALHSEHLSDEAIGSNIPRDIFLNTIRKIKPCVFVHAIKNGSYNSPFFGHRFRSALLHFSSMFEMLDFNFPRDSPERLLIERDVFIPEATNVIACEGSERVERPETYKQWHARMLRAGLVPLSVDQVIKKKLKDFVRRYYRKEFAVDDDNGWLLVSWKGRILYGLTTWKPK